MEKDSLPYDGQNPIGRASAIEDVVTALIQRRCSDLTPLLDLASCSSHPVAGGGFCDVYQGVTTGGTRVAIKTMRVFKRPGKDNDKEKLLKRTARELYYWSQLRHPNVIPLMGLAMFRERVSMISEWMDNGNLVSYIIANPSVNRMDICIDICAGLLYIHDNNMVHGDLKAANVMVSASGTAMITDFGNSTLRDLTLKFTGTTNTSFSLRWAAPELFDEGNETRASKKVDVYAYGMTVLETLTGKVPFETFSDHQVMIMVAVKRKTPTRPRAGVDDQLWQLLQECWAWEQSARPEITVVAERLSDIFTRSVADAEAFKGWNSKLEASSFENKDADPPLPAVGDVVSPSDRAEERNAEHLESIEPGTPTYWTPTQLADAESLHLRLLSARKRLLKHNHPDIVESMAILAKIYHSLGRLAEAESLQREVRAAQQQTLANGQVGGLQSMADLVEILAEVHSKRGPDQATPSKPEAPLQPLETGFSAYKDNGIMVPQWIVDCVTDLQKRYPDTRIDVVLTYNIHLHQEFRLKCLDCPGKLYHPGPEHSLSNFEVHLKNRFHVANLRRRIGAQIVEPRVPEV